MSDEARLAAVLEVRLNRIDEKLSEYNRKVSNSMRKASKDIEAVNDNWTKAFSKKPNLAKALDGVFDNTRLKVMDSGIARVGLLGSAFEELGVVGLGAAAAIALVAAGLAQTRAAAAYGDEIGDMAAKLHVTTDALQEYRYAARLAGDEEKGADEALEKFGVTLGKAQLGLPKALKGFKELGFTKAQIDSFKTVEDALVAVTGRISELGRNQAKDAVVDQLGLTGMKQLVEGGVDSMQRLKAEAQTLGLVMDAGMIARAGVANDKFETLEKIIDIQLKSAFVDLAPVLLNLLQLGADLARQFADVAAVFQSIETRSVTALQDKRDQLVKSIAGDQTVSFLPGVKEYTAHKQRKLDRINAELARREQAAAGNAPAVPNGRSLLDPDADANASAARAKALQVAASSQQAIDRATKDELSARQAVTFGILELASLKAAEVTSETKAANARLESDVAQGKITRAAATAAISLNNRAASERKMAIAAEANNQIEEDRLSKQRELSGVLDQTSNTYAGLARTIEERRKIELQILKRQHEDKLAELGGRRDRALREGRDDEVGYVGRLITAENDNYAADRRQTNKRNLSPMAAWADSLPQSVAELTEAFETLDAQGIQALSSGLADALVNSKSLGQTAANVFKQLEMQVLRMLIEIAAQKAAASLGLPGFAAGGFTGHAPAHKIAGVVHGSEYVFDAASTQRIGVGNLEALRKGLKGYARGGFVGMVPQLPSVGGMRGGGSVVQQFFPNFSGAVMTEDLLKQFKDYADGRADQAALQGAQGGAALSRQQMQKSAMNRLGGRRR